MEDRQQRGVVESQGGPGGTPMEEEVLPPFLVLHQLALLPERFEVARQGRKLREALPLEDPFEWPILFDGIEYIAKVWFGHVPSLHPDRPCKRCQKVPSDFVRLVVIKSIRFADDSVREVTEESDVKLYEALRSKFFTALHHEKEFCIDHPCIRFPRRPS